MTSALFSETVELLTRQVSGRDDYGNDTYEWVAETWPAWLEQRNGSEQQGATEQSVANMWLYLPLDAPASAVQRIRYDGRTWEIDGEPGRQPGGFVVEGYQVVALRKVTG